METLQILDILATIVGLVYIWLEYKASIYLWLLGIIMPAIDIFKYFKAGLYADFGMAIYYLLAAVYGFIIWKFFKKKGQGGSMEMPITHFNKKLIMPSTLVFFVSWSAIYFILVRFTNSTVPFTDSFVNALSFIGLWALARKYVEQWLIWILVDAISCALYVYKGIPFTAALYGLYVIIAILGYYKWKRMMIKR